MADKNWEDILKEAIVRDKVRVSKDKRHFERYVSNLNKLVVLQILIGAAAAYFLFVGYGFKELTRTILNWLIGITLVGTLVTGFLNKYRR